MMIALGLWILMFLALLATYVYRKIVGSSADELVHLSDVSDAVLAKQEATASRIQQIDRMVTILAVVFVVFGVLIGSYQIYRALS